MTRAQAIPVLTSVARRVAIAGAMLAVARAAVPAQSLAYIGGVQYATGDLISTQRTWSAYPSNGLVWSQGRLRASASIPLVMQPAGVGGTAGTSPAAASMGNGMHGGTMTPSSDMAFSRVGVGDPIGRIDVALLPAGLEHPSVILVGAVKAPLAGVERGFGTGKWDVGAGISSAAHIGGTTLLADAVYWKLGNPAGASLRNAVAYSVSIGRSFARSRWSVLGSVSGATRLWVGREPPVQAGIGIGYLRRSGRSMFATVAAGLTHSTPAISTGVGWRVPLARAP